MNPLGPRRNSAISPLASLLAVFLLLASTASAASSVLGIDFGTQNFKAALVKPGIPLEIVLTKDSKRKEAAAVAFKPNRDAKNNIIAEVGSFPERLYGGDALALQGRLPGEVFPNLKPLLGLPWTSDAGSVVDIYKSRYPAVQAKQVQEMGTTVVNSEAFVDEEMPWSVEELLAMELANVKRNAEGMAGKGTTVADVVITVPAFYTVDERRAIERAAQLAGFDVNALISDGLAVGLDYAKSRTFPEVTKGEKPEHHLVFDMGAGSTTATLLRFQAKSVKDVGRFNKTVQEVAVLGAGWDRALGGDSLNQVIVDDYVHKFLTKPVAKSREMRPDALKSNGRVMSRLWKDAEKARQVLSANSDATSSFEELLPEIDFKTKLSRAEFEKLAEPFADRVAGPVNDALAAAKLTLEDVDSIILHGGAVRTPFVQRKLEELAGSSAKLRSNVNADESAVFGAAFKGASLSPSFKVKEIRDSDVAGYAAGMTYIDGSKDRKQQLFGATSPIGYGSATKQVTFKDKEDFTFDLYQLINEVDRAVTRVQTENLTASVAELTNTFNCEKANIATKFSIRLSPADGVPEVVSGSVSCEVDDTAKGSVGDAVKDWFGFGGKKDQEPLKEGEDGETTEEVEATASSSSASGSNAGTASSSGASTSTSRAPEKPKKRTQSVSIAFSTSAQGNPQPAPEEMKRIRDRLAAFDRSDAARVAREEALNVLESYTYYVRDFLGNEDYASVATQAARDEISKLLEAARSFMENASEMSKAKEADFRSKLSGLKKLVEPIQQRRKEAMTRPDKVEGLRGSLEQTEKFVEMVREQIAKASSAQSKASEMEAASSTASSDSSSVTESASASDEWADLEEQDTASTTSMDLPKYSSAADFSPYSDLDLKDLESVYESVSSWLEEKEVEQKKLKATDEPVLLVKDIEAQASKLSSVMTDMVYKKMQKPKASSSKKSKTSTKTKSQKKGKGKGSSTTAAPAEEPTDAGAKPSFLTVGSDDEMPTEEELQEMLGRSKSSTSDHDEL